MSNPAIIAPAFITVPADKWKAYRDAKAKASAMEREAKQLGEQCGIPDADTLARTLAGRVNPSHELKGEIVVQDGNGAPIGKISVFYHPGAVIPSGWRKRES